MPKLPDFTVLGERPAPRVQRGVVSDQSGQIMGRAIEGAANAAQQVIGQRLEQQNQLASATARSSLLQADIAARKELEDDPDWSTYETRYRERMTKASEGATQGIRGSTSREMFSQNAKLDIERGAGAVRDMAQRKEVDVGRAALDNTLASNRSSALDAKDEATRTELVNSSADAIRGARAKNYLSAQESTNLQQKWTTDYAEGFLGIQTLPKRIEMLKNPKGSVISFIDADRRAALLKAAQNELDAEQRSHLTELRQTLSDQMQDISVAAQAGIPITQLPSRTAMIAAFGEHEGAQKYDFARKLSNLSVEIESLHRLPADQLVAQSQSYEPKQVEGAADQAQLHGVMARSVNQILDQRAKDPAGYLTATSPRVKQAWETFNADPTADPKTYISTVRSEQTRLGMRGKDLLPDAYAQSMVDGIQTGPAEKIATRIESEADRWGDAWPEVYGQISSKLSDLPLVIGSGIPRSAATALSATMGLKGSELEAMLPPGVAAKDVKDAVASQFADFKRSLPPEAARTANAVTEAAERLAIKYMSDGSGRGDAVKKAYRDLVESQYSLTDFRGTTMRIPAQLSADTILRGARTSVEQYEPDAKSVIVPRGAALSAEEYAGQWKDYVRRNGYWVTSPNSKGLRLYVDGGPAVTANGPIDMAWADLEKRAGTFDSSAETRRHAFESLGQQ